MWSKVKQRLEYLGERGWLRPGGTGGVGEGWSQPDVIWRQTARDLPRSLRGALRRIVRFWIRTGRGDLLLMSWVWPGRRGWAGGGVGSVRPDGAGEAGV